jgi:hypothetical protein
MQIIILFLLSSFSFIYAAGAPPKPDAKVMERDGHDAWVKTCRAMVIKHVQAIQGAPNKHAQNIAINELESCAYNKLHDIAKRGHENTGLMLYKLAAQLFHDGETPLAAIRISAGKLWQGRVSRIVAEIEGVRALNLYPIDDKSAGLIWAKNCTDWLSATVCCCCSKSHQA